MNRDEILYKLEELEDQIIENFNSGDYEEVMNLRQQQIKLEKKLAQMV
jgi:uncharacterized protein YdcH (DUF465 family)